MKSEVRGQTFGMVPRWVFSHPKLNAQAKVMYAVLSWRIGRNEKRALSHAWLAREIGCSVSAVRRALDDLAAKDVGALTIEPLFDPDNAARIGNVYYVHFEPKVSTPLLKDEQAPLPTNEHPHKEVDFDLGSDLEALDLASQAPGAEMNGKSEIAAEAEPATGANQQALFGAICTALGWDWRGLTGGAQGKVSAAAKQLRLVGASVEDVAAFSAAYRAHWPTVDLTPGAMVSWWPAWRGGQFTPAAQSAPRLGLLDTVLLEARREIAHADVAPDGGRVGREDGPVLPELPSASWDGG